MFRLFSFIFLLSLNHFAQAECKDIPQEQLQQELDALLQAISFNNKRYEAGKPAINDDEYDALIKQQRSLSRCLKKSSEITSETTPPLDNRHRFPMGSLNKAEGKGDVVSFLERAKRLGTPVIVQPKIDGIAIELVYHKGSLVQALSRGQWRSGQGLDLLTKVKQIRAVPDNIPSNLTEVVIHGELYAFPSNEEAQKSASSRHYVAGLMNRQKAPREELEKLQFFPWHWVNSPSASLRRNSSQLEEWGLASTSGYIHLVQDLDDIATLRRSYDLKNQRLELPLDGIVIKMDNQIIQKKLGHNDGTPYWAIAWKFQPQATATKVSDIRWTIGRTGQITVLLDIEPVTLQGIDIETLNAGPVEYVQTLNIAKSDTITIALKGSSTPVMGKVIVRPSSRELAELPDQAHYNGLTCLQLSTACQKQFIARVKWLTGKHGLDLPNFNQNHIEELVDKGRLKKISDIFSLKAPEDISAEAEKILSKPDLSLSQTIRALSIPEVGRKKSLWLAEKAKNWNTILDSSPNQIQLWLKMTQNEARTVIEYLNNKEVHSVLNRLNISH
ncbi:hypothetical protein M3P05_08440 [Sansalvadorimonas sp. 2012CJ34-2]|uniref:DNA ligase (NAD(+)) n=1 Tax=Parendozoicomonas callyspongiae TaxID=2942213 RepID=A0ABT0PF69_9GAMM|nr:hypothetical protein [Sansalvadorimonas sp. 2012CJ34-2]MCL6269965.1 hypothetical protein [Sansalvadorimonas sp. 2012CJ34-2]